MCQEYWKGINKMSYNIQVFHICTMQNFENSKDENFFDRLENFVPFSIQQFEDLKSRLLDYDYEITNEVGEDIHFRKSDDDSTAIANLMKHGLYFSSGFNQDDIFEISMTASEITDTSEFVKFDPQVGEWEV